MDSLSWLVMKEITAQERKPLEILCLLAATEEPCTHNNKSFQYVSLSVRSSRYKAYTILKSSLFEQLELQAKSLAGQIG